MIIVYVIDNYGELSNGTTITALRSKEQLEKRGHTVRVVTAGPVFGDDIYHLEKRRIPIVSKVAEKQQTYFAKPNKKIMMEAFKDADIVQMDLDEIHVTIANDDVDVDSKLTYTLDEIADERLI